MLLNIQEIGDFVVSEQLPNQGPSNFKVISFVVILSFVCALVLSVLASALQEPKEIAKELDRSKQMMIAARIFTHKGYFLMLNDQGEHIPAKAEENGVLVPGSKEDFATQDEILEVFRQRIRPKLVDADGNMKTFEEAGIDYNDYLSKNKKTGYYRLPEKLIYEILPNPSEVAKSEAIGYVVPVNGYGLWDAIYGYLAVKTDGDTVIGISWYDQKETPGLGANIAEEDWQSLFPGKKIFQPSPSGQTDFKSAPIGISVVKGKVSEVLGDSPKAKSAVDGMAGATLTGYGVNDAYKDVLEAYRPFFIKLHNENEGA